MDAGWKTILDGSYDGQPVKLLKFDNGSISWFKVETVQKGDVIGEAYRDGDSVVEGVFASDGDPIEFEGINQDDLRQSLLRVGFSSGAAQDIAREAR